MSPVGQAPSAATTMVWKPSRAIALAHGGRDLLVVEGDLRDEDDVRAAGEAGMQGDPTGVAAHDLHDDGASVALRRGLQAVHGVRRVGHGRVEAEGLLRGAEVVVDRLGDAHDRDAMGIELQRDAHGAVAADDDEAAQSEAFNGLLRGVQQTAGQLAHVALADLGREATAVGRAEDRAATGQETGESLVVEDFAGLRVEEAIETAGDTDGLPAAQLGGLGHGPDDGVHAGTVPSPGDDADPRAVAHVRASFIR